MTVESEVIGDPQISTSLSGAFELLADRRALQRSKGEKALGAVLLQGVGIGSSRTDVESGVFQLLEQHEWEKKLGGLMAAKAYVSHAQPDECYMERLRLAALALLEDQEVAGVHEYVGYHVRVRLAVGECLQVLARRQGLPVLEACLPAVMGSIRRNFVSGQRRRAVWVAHTFVPACADPRFFSPSGGVPTNCTQERSDDEAAGVAGGSDNGQQGGTASPDPTADTPPDSPMGRMRSPSTALGAPSHGAAAASAQACSDAPGSGAYHLPESPACGRVGSSSAASDSSGRLSLVSALLQDAYRRVQPGRGEMRHGTEGWKCLETSMKALQALVEGCGPAVAPHLDEPLRAVLYKALHHPNRFVRETGHLTMCAVCEALVGPELAAIAPEVAELLADGMGDNWSQVRYAACVSTRSLLEWLGEGDAREAVLPVLLPSMILNRLELLALDRRDAWASTGLGRVVDRAAVAPHVPALLRALVLCFKDTSWPVRDAACTATGRAVLAYPDEMRPLADEMLRLWLAHLVDNIPTVRANSAVALAKALRAYGDDVAPALLVALQDMLLRAREQQPESGRYTELPSEAPLGTAQRKARDNDAQVHSDQAMFSCGSLMARFSTSYLIRSDGCMDFGFSRDKEPWEVSDGAVHLLRELAAVRPLAVTDEHLAGLAELGRLSSFQHAFNLHETVWRSLLPIGQAIGKPRFKRHLRELLLPLLADCRCGHALAEAAATQCLEALRTWVGPKILAGYLPQGVDAALVLGGPPSHPQVPSGLLGAFAQTSHK
ncbi:hypothetical protein TSOC_012431 [Tetrabaena socialis]|uniref:Uncharacterized protein n=1 Tax=Tetrabaena socialis TaxID=47790 RepID=A0A2J7ZN24_9CHLO|nr:hypothetical protein TSOC_012431 [Tetrabaena socialis]|eukprot:PNH01665.1 hypothetical protein TSOC_012431 [Tetrabaena socialis]